MTLQDLVRHAEVLVINTVDATFVAYCYETPYKLLCHVASNVRNAGVHKFNCM